MGLVRDLHQPLLLVDKSLVKVLLEASWIALEVQVHVVSDIFWQYRQLLSLICLGALPWSRSITIEHFVEFRGG